MVLNLVGIIRQLQALNFLFIAIRTLFFIASLGPKKNGPAVHSDFEQVDDILEKCISKSHRKGSKKKKLSL